MSLTTRLTPSKSHSAAAVALITYTIIALCIFWHGEDLSRNVFGYGGDSETFVWYLRWWPYALAHGLNPFITDKIWHDVGYNLTWSTSVPFPAFLMSPVSGLLSPVVSYNLLMISAPALGAWSAYLCFRGFFRSHASCFLGGFLYGFSSYECGQLLGHLNLAIIVFIPIALSLSHARLTDRISRRGYISLLTLTCLAQLASSTELLLTASLFGGLLWLIIFIVGAEITRTRLTALALEVTATALITVVIAAPFFYFLFIGLSTAPDQLNSPRLFSADPLNLFIPTTFTWLGGRSFESASHKFTGMEAEHGLYIGLIEVLVIGSLLLSRTGWSVRLRAASLILIIGFIASLGPLLNLLDTRTSIALPWAALENTPIVNSILPTRLSLFVTLSVAFLHVAWLEMRTAWWKWAVSILIVVMILPSSAAVHWFTWPNDPEFTARGLVERLGKDKTILMLPFGQNGQGMAWQVNADLTFNQAAGYGGYVPTRVPAMTAVYQMSDQRFQPGFELDLSAFCDLNHVDYVLVAPETSPGLRAALTKLNWREEAFGPFQLVTVPNHNHLVYRVIEGDHWGSSSEWGWLGNDAHILVSGTSARLSVSRMWQPPDGPTRFSMTMTGHTQNFDFGDRRDMEINVPAGTDLVFHAERTFIPDQTLHNGDVRNLSFPIKVDLDPPPKSADAGSPTRSQSD